jgi:tetratricopeptide (TPR) repeat protein
MSTVWRRHPEALLIASLLLFAATVFGRTVLRPAAHGAAGRAPAPAPVEPGADAVIARLQARLRDNPADSASSAQLGLALLQRVRETADASLYAQAEAAFDTALKHNPQEFDAVVGLGTLALSRHAFEDALSWGERARLLNPFSAQAYGIIGDAQTELGRYDAAAATIQKMIDIRPDLSSYSRVSYQRELHGDVQGAIESMKQAVSAGNPSSEQTQWTRVQLGHLYFNSGDLAQAMSTYRAVFDYRPDYIHAAAGIARVLAAQGAVEDAITTYQRIVQILPLPEYVIALGELYEATGKHAEAQRQYDLVRAIQNLSAGQGVNADLELAMFEVAHGADPAAALRQAWAAYAARPSIHAADVLAWALYRTANYSEARRYSDEALRLGTRDAMLYYHAGMIAFELDDYQLARRHLEQAFAINPAFSIRHASEARSILSQLAE